MSEIQQPKPAYDFEVFLAASPVFTLAELAAARGDPTRREAARNQLKRHVASGRVKSVARELYASVPRGMDPERFVPDPFLVAAAARPDGVFAYHSAFELLGAAHSVWHDCTLHCDRRRTALRVGSTHILFLATPEAVLSRGAQTLATRSFPRATRQLVATGPERTLVEGLRQPHRVGGLDELMECVRGLPLLDFRLLESVLAIYGEKILWAAAGWITEKYAAAWWTPPAFLDQCRRRRPLQHQYLVRDLRGGRLMRDWHLIVPEHLAEEGASRAADR
ncbi:MAG: hypothetical protein ABIV06_05570 [Thermoanaerobaculia bacterium]